MSIIEDSLIEIVKKFGINENDKSSVHYVIKGIENDMINRLLDESSNLGIPNKIDVIGYDEKIYTINNSFDTNILLIAMRNLHGNKLEYKDMFVNSNYRMLICPSLNKYYGSIDNKDNGPKIGKRLMENDNGEYLFDLITNRYGHIKLLNSFDRYYNKVEVLKAYLDKEPIIRKRKNFMTFKDEEDVSKLDSVDWEFNYMTEKLTGMSMKKFNKELEKIKADHNNFLGFVIDKNLDIREYAYKIILGQSPSEACKYCIMLNEKYELAPSRTDYFVMNVLSEKIAEDEQKLNDT